MKLAVLKEVVKDKRVIVVDDSIIRGTTARRRVDALRQAGAREIHVRISCPPVTHPCFFGIDFPTREELVACGKDVSRIRDFIGADSLGYLSVEGLLLPLKNPGWYCTACYTGEYAVDVSSMRGKRALEGSSPDLQLDLGP